MKFIKNEVKKDNRQKEVNSKEVKIIDLIIGIIKESAYREEFSLKFSLIDLEKARKERIVFREEILKSFLGKNEVIEKIIYIFFLKI